MALSTLTSLMASVYTITNRPDLVAETTLAVKQATLKAHQLDFFPKDIFETGIAFATSAYYQQLDYRTLLPNFRAMKYLRKYDSVNSAAGKFLDPITPELLLDRYAVEKTDVYYMAGAEINIKTQEQNQYFLLGCYLNPDTTYVNSDSWIALDHPDAIVIPAAALVYKMIGFDEMAATFNKLSLDQYQTLQTNQLVIQGF